MPESTEVDQRTSAIALVDHPGCPRPIPTFLVDLPWAASDDEAIAEIIEQILRAETADQVIDRKGTIKFEDLLGQTIWIDRFSMRPTDLDEGVGAYALIHFHVPGGDLDEITSTSALGVLAQLAKLHHFQALPRLVSIQEVDTGKKGRNNPLYLSLPTVEADF